MAHLKVFSAAAALVLVVCSAGAQTTVINTFSSLNIIVPDAQLTGVSDTHNLSFGLSNFSSLTDLQLSRFNLKGNGQLTGNWVPDHRNADPADPRESDGSISLLGSFTGTDPNHSWSLLLTDIDFGQQGTVQQWSRVVTAIPEPSTFGCLALGSLVLGIVLLRRRKR